MRRKAEIMVLPFSFPAFKFSPRRRVFTFFFKAESTASVQYSNNNTYQKGSRLLFQHEEVKNAKSAKDLIQMRLAPKSMQQSKIKNYNNTAEFVPAITALTTTMAIIPYKQTEIVAKCGRPTRKHTNGITAKAQRRAPRTLISLLNH